MLVWTRVRIPPAPLNKKLDKQIGNLFKRQLYLKVLIEDLKYPISRIELEYSVSFGWKKKRADIVIFYL
ncbi:type I restriction enzyme HsdR N-terminal domain-containing protein [Apibacter sp. HY039]|uniref:type I restriction enzyme HsdR N-terminal domain-containing protein n=1 Tax=Apibacter sp. HY039 TaxID=2501476 RepID=UPI001C86B35D